jgi:hypothetical protein
VERVLFRPWIRDEKFSFRNRGLVGCGIHTGVSGCRRLRVEELEDMLEDRSVISIERR